MHISEWQYIFQSSNTYFGAAIHILERQYIFQNGNTYFRAAIHMSERQCLYLIHIKNIIYCVALLQYICTLHQTGQAN